MNIFKHLKEKSVSVYIKGKQECNFLPVLPDKCSDIKRACEGLRNCTTYIAGGLNKFLKRSFITMIKVKML